MTRPLSDNEQRLLKAAAQGDTTMLRILEWRVKNFNVRDKQGNTALHLACVNSVNNYEAVQTLARREDVNVNAQNLAGETPFHKLSEGGDTRAVTALLDAHANPFVVDNQGRTPAHSYLLAGFHEGLAVLLDNFYGRKRLLAHQDQEGNTLLHLAAVHAPEVVADLLARGASPAIPNAAGALPEEMCDDPKVKRHLGSMRMAIAKRAIEAAAAQDLEVDAQGIDSERQPDLTASHQSAEPGEHESMAAFAKLAREYIAGTDRKSPLQKP